MLVMVVGSYLIAPVNTAISAITTPTYDASVASLTGLLPLLMIVVIILCRKVQLLAVMLIEKAGELSGSLSPQGYGNPQPSWANGFAVARTVQRLGIEEAEPIKSQIAPATLQWVMI
jgi:hypothetical protein